MVDVRIILAGLWIATMFNNLYGDVLMIFSGDSDKIFAKQGTFTPVMWVAIALIMATPVVMLVLSLTLQYPLIRWANIIVALLWIVFALGQLNAFTGRKVQHKDVPVAVAVRSEGQADDPEAGYDVHQLQRSRRAFPT